MLTKYSQRFYMTALDLLRSINNGIDLDGEGGMVWFKNRNNTNGHRIVDTEQGATESLESNETNAEANANDGFNCI